MTEKKQAISERFYNLYQRNWKRKGKSEQDFVDAVKALDPECGLRKNYLSRLLNGHQVPSAKYLSTFCTVLGVDFDEFFPAASYKDEYSHAPEYQDAVSAWHERVAKESFGLSLPLLKGLQQLLDFGAEFPLFAPLECVRDDGSGLSTGLKYERAELVEAAQVSTGSGLFQIVSDGKVYNLSPIDMKYLQWVQDFIVERVRQLFAQHRQELIDAAHSASDECIGHTVRSLLVSGHEPLTQDDLQRIDTWGIYNETELDKYNIPVAPAELHYTSAHTEKGIRIGHV